MITFILNVFLVLLVLFLIFLLVKFAARLFGVALPPEAIQILGLVLLIIFLLYLLGAAGTFGQPWRLLPPTLR
jgi:hypothetical protein